MKYVALAPVLFLIVPACQAQLAGSDADADEPGGAAGAGGQAGSPTVPDGPCTAHPVVPRARLWRLPSAQYANTVAKVLGVDANVSAFPPDGVSDDAITKFDTNADKNLVSDQLASVYEIEAARLAAVYVGKLTPSTPCILSANAANACVSAFVKDLAGKAYRRPAQMQEAQRLVELYTKARGLYDAPTATRMAIEAVLQSPHFLYRFELGEPGGKGKVPLTPHELASELSYFLADGPPDEELRKAADAGELKTPASMVPHIERLLQAPEARAKMQTFLGAYLGIQQLADGKSKDATAFPMFTPELKAQLVKDGLGQAGRVAFEDGGSFDALFDADVSLSANLAGVYGSQKRKSLLTHPAVIAAMSNEATTSPVHRGLFFRRSMLCNELPPPPANAANDVAKLKDPDNEQGTEREQWAYFKRSSGQCRSCHELFHPIGLGLENYDPIGRFRATDGGKPIDLTVTMSEGDPEIDGEYKDAVALAKAIAASRQGRACFALQYTTFAMGRSVPLGVDDESCRLQKLVEPYDGKPLSLKGLLTAMVQDEGFFYRSYP